MRVVGVEGPAATGAGVEGPAATGAAVRPPVLLDVWPLEELEQFEAEATRKYNEATTEEFQATATASLLQGIPSEVREAHGLPDSIEAEASSELCK